MTKTIFEEMGGTYRQVGDYLLPNITVPALISRISKAQTNSQYQSKHQFPTEGSSQAKDCISQSPACNIPDA